MTPTNKVLYDVAKEMNLSYKEVHEIFNMNCKMIYDIMKESEPEVYEKIDRTKAKNIHVSFFGKIVLTEGLMNRFDKKVQFYKDNKKDE